MELKGIDVSYCQANIDWVKVKASGISFAFIKSSQGGSVNESKVNPFKDPYFEQNIVNASNAGIKCGVYHYMTGTTLDDVIKEANYLTSILALHKARITFPVAIDIEHGRYNSLDKTFITELVKAFICIIKVSGYTPVLYSFRAFLNGRINPIPDIDVWLALWYKERSNSPKPTYTNMTAWQWSDKGTVDGIKGNVDMNVCYKDYSTRVKGDIDGDGDTDSKDALTMKRAILGTYKLTDEQEKYADMNGDGEIDSKDYLALRRKILQ